MYGVHGTQLRCASYLNLIEPWGKGLKSLVPSGRRFEIREEVCRAIEETTAYWTGTRPPAAGVNATGPAEGRRSPSCPASEHFKELQ